MVFGFCRQDVDEYITIESTTWALLNGILITRNKWHQQIVNRRIIVISVIIELSEKMH
jgi:hypothetical protein